MSARILLIEDDPSLQEIVKRALEVRGFRVDAASDGFGGVQLLKKCQYDVALVDYQLPDMDGYASARVLRDLAQDRPKLIAVTANPSALEARPGADDLFEVILPKPFNIPTLVGHIEAALRDPRRSQLIADVERLWCQRGLACRPKAKVVPEPSAEQILALGVCFHLVDWPQAELILLTDVRASSLDFGRSRSDAYLLPIVALVPEVENIADATFQISSAATWGNVAATLTRFNQNRRELPEQYLYASDFDDKLLAYLALSGRPLAPIPDASQPSCVRYPGFFPEGELVVAAERLANRGLLNRRFVDRFHVCVTCDSHRLNVREECPNCRSPNLEETSLLHHFKCAHLGPEDQFRSGSHLICPKCRATLRHYGEDYDKPGFVNRCGACGSWNSEPIVGFSCLDCGSHMDGDAAPKQDLFAYTLSQRARRMLATAVLRPALGKPIPQKLADALVQLAADGSHAVTDFAVIEVRYNSRFTIIARDGMKAFAALRCLFFDNLVNLLAEFGEVISETDNDYIVVRSNDDESELVEFASALLTRGQEHLARDLSPSFRILNARELAAVT